MQLAVLFERPIEGGRLEANMIDHMLFLETSLAL